MKAPIAAVLFLFAQVATGASSPLLTSDALESNYDVIVVGAGTGGVAAAVQAARMGARVALLEETDWIGGQLTAAGVSTIDEFRPSLRTGGILNDYITNLRTIYEGRPTATALWSETTISAEPSKAQLALKGIIDGARNGGAQGGALHVSLYTKVANVTMTGNAVSGVRVSITHWDRSPVTTETKDLTLKVLVDATEYGDLLPLIPGLRYRIGNLKSDSLNLSTALANTGIQNITYTAVIRKYGAYASNIPQGLSPSSPPNSDYPSEVSEFSQLIRPKGPGVCDGGQVTPAVQGSLRSVTLGSDCYIEDPVSKVKVYSPVWTWAYQLGYRGMPDSSNTNGYWGWDYTKISRTGLNRANDYPNSLYYLRQKTSEGFPDTSRSHLTGQYLFNLNLRRQVNCQAKLKTLQYLYYLQHDMGMASSGWSVANDEGYDSPYHLANFCADIPAAYKPLEQFMPVIPYVRESRRMIGLYTLTAKDIQRPDWSSGVQCNNQNDCNKVPTTFYASNPNAVVVTSGREWAPSKLFPTSVALGEYGSDLHNTEENSLLEADLEQFSDAMNGAGRFQIPFEAFIPEAIDGFVPAEKNFSQSRLANGATREHPTTMRTGQAVGAIAALAATRNGVARNVLPIEVQKALTSTSTGVEITHRYFTDVPRTASYWGDVQIASTRNVFKGVVDNSTANRTFLPQQNLTRAEAAVILFRLIRTVPKFVEGTPPDLGCLFPDVPATHWAAKEICAIRRAGITTGNGTGIYDPNGIVTNAQMAVFIARGLNLNKDDIPATPYFSDIPSGHWAFKEIQAAAKAGVALGCSSSPANLCPNTNVQRSRAAQWAIKSMGYIDASPDLRPAI